MRCTQGRLAAIAWRAAAGYGFRRDDICYCPMPLFHGNAIMALWAPALSVGATGGPDPALQRLRLPRRRPPLPAPPVSPTSARPSPTSWPPPSDPTTPTTRSARDSAPRPPPPTGPPSKRRFGCRLVEGYGSSEGGAVINVTPDTPPGSLGLPAAGDDVAVIDPDDRGASAPGPASTPPAASLNADEAIGEIVNRGRAAATSRATTRTPTGDAERVHDGWYWSGDLGYRDEAGFFYFAGRGGDWLRVDSENFAAAPVERIVERHPDLAAVAVYAVADPRSGDAGHGRRRAARPGPPSIPTASPPSWPRSPTWAPSGRPASSGVMAALPLTATGQDHQGRAAPERLAV